MTASVISFINFKGGVGKTALTVNLAISMAYHWGKKVLVIDLDPQSNASIQLMKPDGWKAKANNNPSATVYGLLMNQNPIASCIVNLPLNRGKIRVSSIDLVPSCYELMDFEHQSISHLYPCPCYVFFWKQIKICINLYDIILIDCPPNLYRTSECAIFSSDYILVPCNPDALSLVGLSLLAKKIYSFKQTNQEFHFNYRQEDKEPEIAGIIINNLPTNQTIANLESDKEFSSKLQSLKRQKLLSSNAELLPITIRQAAAFRTASFKYAPPLLAERQNKDLIHDYKNLANWICQKYR